MNLEIAFLEHAQGDEYERVLLVGDHRAASEAVASVEITDGIRNVLNGELLWKTGQLGIDGVLVHKVSPTRIEGSGEWDPPGGWRPFVLTPTTGERG